MLLEEGVLAQLLCGGVVSTVTTQRGLNPIILSVGRITVAQRRSI